MMQLRELIVKILRSAEGPIGAYDIARQVSQIRRRKCHANSIYRVLAPMVRSGEVGATATTRCFAILDQGDRHLIWCIRKCCNACLPIEASAIHNTLAAAAREKGFQPAQQHVELMGPCGQCSHIGPGLTMI